MMRNITIAFSQPDSERPNIRLTLFDVSAITAIMGLLVGFVDSIGGGYMGYLPE